MCDCRYCVFVARLLKLIIIIIITTPATVITTHLLYRLILEPNGILYLQPSVIISDDLIKSQQ